MEDRLYFRQLLAGRDFAPDDQIARQMVNFVYLIGDRETGDAVAVDPAYAPGELVDVLAADGMRLSGVLVTHYHPDHVGGDLGGWSIAGVAELLALPGVEREDARARRRSPGRQARHRLLRLRPRAARVGRRRAGRRDPDHAHPHARAHARVRSASSSTASS